MTGSLIRWPRYLSCFVIERPEALRPRVAPGLPFRDGAPHGTSSHFACVYDYDDLRLRIRLSPRRAVEFCLCARRTVTIVCKARNAGHKAKAPDRNGTMGRMRQTAEFPGKTPRKAA